VAQEPTQVTVPDVVGRSQNEATTTLSGAGLQVDVKDKPVDSPDKDGIVQAQSADPDTKVRRGSAVTITVGVFDPVLNPDPGATTPPATPTTPTTTPATPPPAAR
jgi:serine/threonine-protein kinase